MSDRPAPGVETDFWTGYQPGFRASDAPVGSPAFFAEVEERRYRLEPAIKEIVGFERWSGRDVLEVGCGIATDGVSFARADARYTGVDTSPTAVEQAGLHFEAENLEGNVLPASALDLPFEDGSFDLVYSNGVIHHIADTRRTVEEMHRVLRPGGRAIVMVYHRASLNYRVNIMVIRRALALSLGLPGGARAVTQLTGERDEVIEGHRQLLAEHGLRYLADRELFLSNNTDGPGNHLSKVYSRNDARVLFRRFAGMSLRLRFLNLRIYPAGERLEASPMARRLERRFGWHLWIEAVKAH